MSYCLYLRKSRKDEEAEAAGQGETLARHKALLMETAKRMGLAVSGIYKEIVSGESIADRPEMQRMLQDVADGKWEGVLVAEVERLARGDTMDQGLVQQTFTFTGTKIITPGRVYDPDNQSDSEYFEFGLFMSRREYSTIKRRLLEGRERSIREGKYPNPHAAYGYKVVRVDKGKGCTLDIIPEEAEIVRMVFDWYVNGTEYKGRFRKIGTGAIATKLNSMGVPTRFASLWAPSTIRNMLRNPVYTGKVSWYKKSLKRAIVDGKPVKKMCRTPEKAIVCDGIHEAIISNELFDKAQQILAAAWCPPVRNTDEVKNPFIGLLRCAKCGHIMQQQSKNGNAYLCCRHVGCTCVSNRTDLIEARIIQSIDAWFRGYSVQASAAAQIIDTNSELAAVQRCEQTIADLRKQRDNLYGLLERGIYSDELFLERQGVIASEIQNAERSLVELRASVDAAQARAKSASSIIPAVKTVLDTYADLQTAQQKNSALKQIIERIEYNRDVGGFGSDPNNFQIKIFPRIPFSE